MARFQYQPYPYRSAPELAGQGPERYPVVIVGAGPVGLAAAIDLALHGVKVVVLDDNDVVSVGSRAICWSKRTLEIFDRLGVGARMVEKGVTWQVGRLFHGDTQVYAFDLLAESGHRMPAFINLQQYYIEQYLVERAADFPDLIDLRWKNKVVGLDNRADGVTVSVETPEGPYRLEADHVVACDGARSGIRAMLSLDFAGRVFEERFLIADIEMKAEFPPERLFWFDPSFHSGQSALLHKQPDDIWRIDLQLGWDTDPDVEKQPERVIPRIRAVVGDRPFTLDWVSVYTFQCRRLDRFVHGRVIFAGDSAHVVSPFGARGGNGGIQDIDNLGWKLALVVQGRAPESLIESYNAERVLAADDNIFQSSRSTNFMTPKSPVEQAFRKAALDLAAEHPFARRLVNSGRLSLPCSLAPLWPTDLTAGAPGPKPGEACIDAPVAAQDERGFLLSRLGHEFKLLAIGAVAVPEATGLPVIRVGAGGLDDVDGWVASRYGTDIVYLIRPDQHVAARYMNPTAAEIAADLARQWAGAEGARP